MPGVLLEEGEKTVPCISGKNSVPYYIPRSCEENCEALGSKRNKAISEVGEVPI